MWPSPQETVDLVTFTKKIFNGKLHFLCSENSSYIKLYYEMALKYFMTIPSQPAVTCSYLIIETLEQGG